MWGGMRGIHEEQDKRFKYCDASTNVTRAPQSWAFSRGKSYMTND